MKSSCFISKRSGAALACSVLMMSAYPSFAATAANSASQNKTAIANSLSSETPMQDDLNGAEARSLSANDAASQAENAAWSTPLHCGVRKIQQGAETDVTTLQGRTDATSSLNDTPLQGRMDNTKLQAVARPSAYKLAAEKLSKGFKLSADEYRALNAGCAGYESSRTFFQNIAVVTVVYKNSPAYSAGIRKGDKLLDVDAEQDRGAVDDPTIPRWQVTCGQAGTQVKITLLRNNKPIDVTLTRMNIEDIPEARFRHEWEQILSQFGNPKEGVFSGLGADPLAKP